jgi:hypothetical protein
MLASMIDETAIHVPWCPAPAAPAARASYTDDGRGKRTQAQPARSPLTLRWRRTPDGLIGAWAHKDGRATPATQKGGAPRVPVMAPC